MNRGSLVQDLLNEVSSRTISFQIRLHLLITLVKSSEYFRFIESLRTCIMASHLKYKERPWRFCLNHDWLSPLIRETMPVEGFPRLKVMDGLGNVHDNVKEALVVIIFFTGIEDWRVHL